MGETCGTYASRFMKNWYEKTLGAAKVRIGYFGNLRVIITTDMKISLEHAKFLWIMQQRRQQQQHSTILRSLAKMARMKTCSEKPKLVVSFWQSCGHQQNQYEKTFGIATVLTGYFGNLMATITTDMNISLERSKSLWIISAIFRSPAKLVRKDAWNSQSSCKLFWKSYGHHHNRHENQPGMYKVLMDYIGNLQVTSKIGTEKNSWHNHSSYRLFWQSYGWRHNRYENKLETDSKMYRNSIGGANIV